MGFSFDISQLKGYNQAMIFFQKDFNQFLKNLLIEMAERIIAKTKPRTPVDTGALRNAWQLGEIKGVGKDISVEILNPMEYATEIEYGHRIVRNNMEVGWYEGRFMLKISIDEIRRQIPLRYQAEFKKFCIQHRIKI